MYCQTLLNTLLVNSMTQLRMKYYQSYNPINPTEKATLSNLALEASITLILKSMKYIEEHLKPTSLFNIHTNVFKKITSQALKWKNKYITNQLLPPGI